MSTEHVDPGEVIDPLRRTTTPNTNQKSVLIQTPDFELSRLFIPAGSTIPTYEAAGQIILQCVEGRVTIAVRGTRLDLRVGRIVYLSLNDAFSIHGREKSTVLATVITSKQGRSVPVIGEQ